MSNSAALIETPTKVRLALMKLGHVGPLTSFAVPVLASLALVGATTIVLLAVGQLFVLDHVAIGYLIPVMIAATRWGVVPAVICALASVGASAFFFYPPIYSFHVSDPQHVADLILFVLVAVVTGKLAANVREHVEAAHRRELKVTALYEFSRRLAVAARPDEIYRAIQDHISAITGCRVVMFEAGASRSGSGPAPQTDQVPSVVRDAILALLEERSGSDAAPFVDDAVDTGWLIRSLSQRNSVLGILAIEIGPVAQDNREATRQRIDAALAEASATLERIDVANAINDANLRIQTDTLREALIGSVSHELRTPLASIIGCTSILVGTPAIVQDPRLAALAGVVREEAERLDGDIQNLLNASRISGSGVRPRLEWSDPADIISAAVERHRRRLGAQSVEVQMPDDLPLVHVDSILIEQALGQVVDNAIKYSAPDTTVRITAYCGDNEIAIMVEDRGSGLTGEEQDRIWERFYRGSRHAGSVPGSGLGMWIAQSFVQACGGSLEAVSAGIGQGTKVTLRLAAARQPDLASAGAADD